MNPTVIVLNVCAAIFLTLFIVFISYLVYQLWLATSEKRKIAKEVPFYNSESMELPSKKQASYQLAQAK